MSTGMPDGVREAILERTVPRRRHGDDSADMAVRDVLQETTRHLLDLLSGRMEVGEAVRDVHSRHEHRVGPRGVRVDVSLLVLTDRRILLAVDGQIDEVPAQVMALQYGQVEVRPKRIQMGVKVLLEATGVAVEVARGKADAIRAALTAPPAEAVWLVDARSGVPPPGAVATSPAGWHPDPAGRHEHRYWDGNRWTDHVADTGVQSADPLS